MWRLRFRRRFAWFNVIVASATLAAGLGFIWATAEPNINEKLVCLVAVAPEDHNEEAMETHARRAVSAETLKTARAELWPPAGGREPRDRGAWSGVFSAEDGRFFVVGKAVKEADALAFANALADAYIQSQNRDRLAIRMDDEETRQSSVIVMSRFGEPREIAWGIVLTLVFSALLLFAPLHLLNPVRVARRLREGVRRRPRRALLILALSPVALLALSLFGLFPWSGLNCGRSDVDINTGRVRFTYYLFWCPVYQAVRDSSFTEALPPEEVAGKEADWRAVVTLSPGLHYSPHHAFHGAFQQIRSLERCLRDGSLTPAAHRAVVERVLQIWRRDQSYFSTYHYINDIAGLAFDARDEGRKIDVGDLPNWEEYEKKR